MNPLFYFPLFSVVRSMSFFLPAPSIRFSDSCLLTSSPLRGTVIRPPVHKARTTRRRLDRPCLKQVSLSFMCLTSAPLGQFPLHRRPRIYRPPPPSAEAQCGGLNWRWALLRKTKEGKMKRYGMKRELGPPICSMCVCNRPANGWEAVHNLIGAFPLRRKCARGCVSLCKWRDARVN